MEDSSESKESPTQAAGAAVLEKKPNPFQAFLNKLTGGKGEGPPPPPTAVGSQDEDLDPKAAVDEAENIINEHKKQPNKVV